MQKEHGGRKFATLCHSIEMMTLIHLKVLPDNHICLVHHHSTEDQIITHNELNATQGKKTHCNIRKME